MPLTHTAIRQAKPKDKPYKLSDAQGLYLEVRPNGSKYWRMKYRFAGKEKRLAIGVYPTVTLAKARAKRDEARDLLINQDIDPSRHKREQKRLQKVKVENSFEAIAREWHDNEKGGWSANHADKILRSLEADAFPAIGSHPIEDITPPILLDMLRGIEQRGALEMAAKVRQRCERVFRYAIQTGRALHNPATELRGALKTAPKSHYAALTTDDLPAFFSKLEALECHLQTRLALKLMALTFVRTNELRSAEWSEFDLDKAEWRIPAERMKMRVEHIVPLSDQAVEIIRTLQDINGHRRYLFPSAHNPRKPTSNNAMLFAVYRMGYKGKATVHGFRATASTALNEMGFPSDVIERQLAHAESNKVRAAYNRAQYLKERRILMQRWAHYLGELAAPVSEDEKDA